MLSIKLALQVTLEMKIKFRPAEVGNGLCTLKRQRDLPRKIENELQNEKQNKAAQWPQATDTNSVVVRVQLISWRMTAVFKCRSVRLM